MSMTENQHPLTPFILETLLMPRDQRLRLVGKRIL